MGYNQNIWGEYVWIGGHLMTVNYPYKPSDEDKYGAVMYFTSLKYMLPCEVCKKNYKQKLNEKPIKDHVNSRLELFKWWVDVHNMVNRCLGKKEWNYEKARKHYEKIIKKPIYLTQKEELIAKKTLNDINYNVFQSDKNDESSILNIGIGIGVVGMTYLFYNMYVNGKSKKTMN